MLVDCVAISDRVSPIRNRLRSFTRNFGASRPYRPREPRRRSLGAREGAREESLSLNIMYSLVNNIHMPPQFEPIPEPRASERICPDT